ncbi:glycosyltransferase [Modicisalibacter tunisiensis]|uniref:Glycosyltransferase family 2 protein n=1 Tax=Modicisalibacter tunisiensis TaxID=390637 RepID=A0ABS7WWV3_9GAMM|nr:glycosyltransferase family A protein [Modicisalibacter tunisiensis]MBZ9567095.1 glycosyltransferase family 2 protein [Modicisalibacter tunisiensis]
MHSYSVILDARRGHARLGRCLAGLARDFGQTPTRHEIWLLVDKSRSRIERLADTHGARQLLLPDLTRGQRLNIAANRSQADVLLFLDPAIDPPPGWLTLVDQALTSPQWDVVALVSNGWLATHWLSRLPGGGGRIRLLAMRHSWFERVGGFDPEREGTAERDLLVRLRACHASVLQRRMGDGQRSAG